MAKIHLHPSALIFIHCFMFTYSMIVRNLNTDQLALLQFIHQINDTNNILTNNWTTTPSVCNWMGVSCAAKHARIRGLELPGMNLTGTIPPQIGNLSFLVSLDLSDNRFHGDIPDEISNLRHLRTLRLGSNKLSGSIPSSIYNMSSLRIISSYNNTLSGNIPDELCRHLPNLEILYLDANQFSGHIPTTINECTNLQALTLDANRLTGTIPTAIGNLTRLNSIYLDGNHLEGEIPSEIGNLLNLEVFSAVNMRLIGRIPTSIGNLTKLKELYLGPNKLTGEIPWEIGNLQSLEIFSAPNMTLTGLLSPLLNISSLREIYLMNNSLYGKLPEMRSVPNLEELHLWGNNLSGSIPESITNCSKLRNIALMANLFSGNIPNNLGNLEFLEGLRLWTNNLTTEFDSNGEWTFFSSLTNCKHLRVLDLAINPLYGLLPTSISNLSTSLEVFTVIDCKIGGTIPMELATLNSATMLQLGSNRLVGSIPPTLGRLENLQLLSLTGNKLQGSIPHELCHLKGLYELALDGNELDGPMPTCMGELSFLRNLYLSSNKLHSPIPSTFWDLRDILQVDLSSNYFNGSLPLEIGHLEVLTYLDLSSNRFQGPIPISLADLVSLQRLDLSNNNFSGTIPKSLERLHVLSFLNLSMNRLEGEIPSGGPFLNFTNESFMNNYALCGSPRLQVSSCKSIIHRNSKKTLLRVLRYVLPIFAAFIIAFVCILVCIILKNKKKGKKLAIVEDPNPLKEWKRISYHQLSKGTDGFSGENMVGSGGFGTVYKGILSDGTEVAIKVFNLQTEGGFRSFDIECEVMSKIIHRNLVKIITCCSTTDFKALVLEFMPNGSLEKWLDSENCGLDILQRINIMIDVASALEYLHSEYSVPIIHCDLKPSNVLLDKDMVAHVGDFGIAKLLGEADSFKQTMTLATIGYMAPEYGSAGIISVKSDVYSYGILVMETFTRKKPTDENLPQGMSLKHWVERLESDGIVGAGDPSLVHGDDKYFVVKANCISSILKLALGCSADLPEDRTDLKNVGSMLINIKRKFLNDIAEG